MAHATRSRQASNAGNTEKINAKDISAEKVTKLKNVKSKLNAKKVLQDENAVSTEKRGKVQSMKNTHSKTVLGSKLHRAKKDDSLVRKNTVLAMKSPVLRDRTNTSNEVNTIDNCNKKNSNKIVSNENKKSVKKSTVTSVTKKNEKNVQKTSIFPKRSLRKRSSQESLPEPMKKGQLIEDKCMKVDDEKDTILPKSKKKTMDNSSEIKDKDEQVMSKLTESQDSNVMKNKVCRRKNISIEDLEELLNRDEETESNKLKNVQNKKGFEIDDSYNQESNQNLESKNKKNMNENQVKESQGTKKFFKNKVREEIKSSTITKKNVRKQVQKKKNGVCKKVQNKDSTFNPEIEEERKTMEPSEKQLRPRAAKNYCEDSKLSQNSNSPKDKAVQENHNPVQDHKGLPIYKTISLSQEKVQDKEEIYEFPDDSQESEQKRKKRKKAAKKPVIKRVRKAVVSKPIIYSKTEKKQVKKVPHNVHFEEQVINPIIEQNSVVINNIQPTYTIPEHLQDAGDSTIQEASTIKIIGDRQLEASKRISLTATPPVPKTINSELKLYGPKNAITSRPTTQYSNMVNHSLIRKSMSPITKLEENFDAGSPWRPIETFSRIQKMVQSTPQINRLPLNREKKLPIQVVNLQKKSFSSQDTIHISSLNDETLDKEKNKKSITPIKENEVSPRKFGTVISNLSSTQSKSAISVNNSLIENNLQPPIQAAQKNQKSTVQTAQISQPSPVEASLPPTSFPDLSMENVSIPVTSRENTIPSLKKSPKKKITPPSPFRFEKIRSSRRIASIESKSLKSNAQKGSEEPDSEAGPSWLDKPKPTTLRQSNLNNFLNLDEMPESTRISTAHGIFDDAHSTPINGKKPKKLFQEPNIENAFGFDFDVNEDSLTTEKVSIIATEKDVKESKKGKLFVKARVKSAIPSRISANTLKKTLKTELNKVKPNGENLRKEKSGKEEKEFILKGTYKNESDKENDSEVENDTFLKDFQNDDDTNSTKKALLNAVSFSDTFDILSENGEHIKSKVPDEIPLFIDLEPVHFETPPRRSYCKRKRAVYFNTSNDFEDDEEDDEKPKPKKKKESKLSKEDQKRMQEWVKNINETFDEIEHFDLVVE